MQLEIMPETFPWWGMQYVNYKHLDRWTYTANELLSSLLIVQKETIFVWNEVGNNSYSDCSKDTQKLIALWKFG